MDAEVTVYEKIRCLLAAVEDSLECTRSLIDLVQMNEVEKLNLVVEDATERAVQAMNQRDYESAQRWLHLAFRASERLDQIDVEAA